MHFVTRLNEALAPYYLLSNPFYQAWNMGYLEPSTLQVYAREYYQHVAAFPRYISGIHARCPDLRTRQLLLGHLIEEEQGDENHPELWARFAEGTGLDRNQLLEKAKLPETNHLVDGYFEMTESGFAEGLGALYAYERQTPEVSKSKIEGLEKHYGIKDERSLKFFKVHIAADEWHTQECLDLIHGLDESDKEKAFTGAVKGAKLLWDFLDGMMKVHENNSH